MNAPFAQTGSIIPSGTAIREPKRILLLAHAYQAPYRAMRCAAATGAKVFVFATSEARSLGVSRFCAGIHEFRFDPMPDLRKASAEIEGFIATHGIDMVMPADAVTTRFLACIRPLLKTPVFPIPDLEAFDQLATKDRFMDFCRARDIRHPEGHLLANRAALMAAIKNDAIRLPAILKPVNRWGGVGVIRIDKHNAEEIAAKIDYAPILVQDYVEGVDRSISVFCRGGVVSKQVTYSYPDAAFTFQGEPELARIVGGIVRGLKLDGVFNFDARIEADGTVWLLECNPRFFFTMDAAMIAGANFAKIEDGRDSDVRVSSRQPGPVVTVADGELRQPEALLRHLLRGRAPNIRDWKMLIHWLKDPVYFGLAVAGYKRRWNANWLERLRTA
jgi:hypothetical protein